MCVCVSSLSHTHVSQSQRISPGKKNMMNASLTLSLDQALQRNKVGFCVADLKLLNSLIKGREIFPLVFSRSLSSGEEDQLFCASVPWQESLLAVDLPIIGFGRRATTCNYSRVQSDRCAAAAAACLLQQQPAHVKRPTSTSKRPAHRFHSTTKVLPA